MVTALWLGATPALATTVDYHASPAGSGTLCTAAAPCSLSEALGEVNAGDANRDVVTIDLASGTYPEEAYEVDGGSPASLMLDGAANHGSVLTGGDSGGADSGDQVLSIGVSYPVTIENLVLEDGFAREALGSDLLADGSGTVTFIDGVINNGVNYFDWDLADVSLGTLIIEDSLVEHAASSTGGAGAVGFSGARPELQVRDSTFDNSAKDVIAYNGATSDIANSTLVGQTVSGAAAAWNYGGTMNVLDSTFSDDAGALFSAGSASTVNFGGNILAATVNCVHSSGQVYNDSGYNVATDSSCPSGTGGKQGVPASQIGLGPLASNGGPTTTERITTSSAAYDIAPVGGSFNVFCSGDDQRGVVRTQPGAHGCDAGSYQVAPPTVTSLSTGEAVPGTWVTVTGTNLSVVSVVTFRSTSATFDHVSPTSLKVKVPSISAGSATITVKSPDGSATHAFTVS